MPHESPTGLNWQNCILEVNLPGGTRLWEEHGTFESAIKSAQARVEFAAACNPAGYLDIAIYQRFKIMLRMVANHGRVLYNEWR